MKLTPILAAEYVRLFDSCIITPSHKDEVAEIASKIRANKARYDIVAIRTNVPWYVVGVIHNMESGLNFNSHLHNGDPLTSRTKHVPAGRPKISSPPFTWEFSAEDALVYDNLANKNDWSLAELLFRIEGFNGFGYRMRHPETLSPYLWSYSNHYIEGKFTADGRYDPDAVSHQCGAATILHLMDYTKVIQIPR